jgi:glycosyltransferase involved in cell wall biosynthesis
MNLSIVIPVFRSAATLAELAERLIAVCDSLHSRYEILFVDDGSPDDSWQRLEDVRRRFPDRIIQSGPGIREL